MATNKEILEQLAALTKLVTAQAETIANLQTKAPVKATKEKKPAKTEEEKAAEYKAKQVEAAKKAAGCPEVEGSKLPKGANKFAAPKFWTNKVKTCPEGAVKLVDRDRVYFVEGPWAPAKSGNGFIATGGVRIDDAGVEVADAAEAAMLAAL